MANDQNIVVEFATPQPNVQCDGVPCVAVFYSTISWIAQTNALVLESLHEFAPQGFS